jgi:hypothetical protein
MRRLDEEKNDQDGASGKGKRNVYSVSIVMSMLVFGLFVGTFFFLQG